MQPPLSQPPRHNAQSSSGAGAEPSVETPERACAADDSVVSSAASSVAPVEVQTPESMQTAAIIRRTIWATVLLLVVSLLASWLARDWLTIAGEYLIGEYGGRGIFTSVFFIDWVPIPATPEPIFLLGISAGMDMQDLFVASASGAVVASLGCYASGAVLERTTPVRTWVCASYPGLVAWVEKHGYPGLALAAFIPLPFSPMMWIAGIIGMPLERVVIISSIRIVKTAFYLAIIAFGWGAT